MYLFKTAKILPYISSLPVLILLPNCPNIPCAGRHWLLHAVGDDINDKGDGGGGCAYDDSVI